MAAGFVLLLQDRLIGWKGTMIPGIVSSSYAFANAGLGYPIWAALSTDLGLHVSYPASFATIGLIGTTLWAISQAIPERTQAIRKK